jgi:hypothetical protein
MQKDKIRLLGIRDVLFFPQRRSDQLGRRTDIGVQDAESVRRRYKNQRVWHDGPIDVCGGHVLFTFARVHEWVAWPACGMADCSGKIV